MINPDDNIVIIYEENGQKTIMSIEDFNALPDEKYQEPTDEGWEQFLRERAMEYC